MKNFFLGLLTLTFSSLAILNFTSGIIAGIWLLILGEWQLVLFGFILGFIMPWVYSIASIPQFLILPLLVKFGEKGHKFLFSLFGFILSLYNNFLLGAWVTTIFGIMIQFHINPIPTWLWGYATIMGPIGYMASKEDRDSTGTLLGALFCQVSYIILTFCYYYLGSETLGYGLVWLLLIAFSSLAIFLGFAQMVFEKRTGGKVSENVLAGEIVESLLYCPSCSKEIQHGAKYCKNCGKGL